MFTPRKPKQTRRPFVFLNIATTADGKIAPANRHFSPFAGKADHTHLFELRAEADAIVSGARTVDLSPVKLDSGGEKYRKLRLARGLAENPLRVIVTGSGTLDPRSTIFKHRFSPIIILTTERASHSKIAQLSRLADEVKICGESKLDLPAALKWLKRKWCVNKLLCEGGGETNALFIEAGVVDEIHLTLSPVILGGRVAPTLCDGAGFPNLIEASRWKLKSQSRVGDELFIVYRAA